LRECLSRRRARCLTGRMSESEPVRSRKRRLRGAIEAVDDAVAADRADHSVPDAVARALDALYDLAELVRHQGGYTTRSLDNHVAGDVGGKPHSPWSSPAVTRPTRWWTSGTCIHSARIDTARAHMVRLGLAGVRRRGFQIRSKVGVVRQPRTRAARAVPPRGGSRMVGEVTCAVGLLIHRPVRQNGAFRTDRRLR
jgi:hypothetical protein